MAREALRSANWDANLAAVMILSLQDSTPNVALPTPQPAARSTATSTTTSTTAGASAAAPKCTICLEDVGSLVMVSIDGCGHCMCYGCMTDTIIHGQTLVMPHPPQEFELVDAMKCPICRGEFTKFRRIFMS